ncbi:adenylate/guanylate cyclase domain-containing protein [Coleofasciculus sp. LEGE 07092]|uniref:adenylate/guanylate cyclase domain-containing protein n=2 Tax=unclassified Coleofasciculus TaxID=2692782 RepID=UPI001D1436E1|nr:adenylate/guanylate cyclase domain-containing protein [Coleofasciculus sp. LEGE 07092]
MKVLKRLIPARRRLSITTKFALAFIALLLLIGVVALTGFISLRQMQRETKAVMVTSIEVQRQGFRMDAALRNARRLETDFFLQWPSISFSSAKLNEFRAGHRREIEQVLAISSELQELLAKTRGGLLQRRSNPDLVEYVEIVEQYSRSFQETVGWVSNLGMADVGVLEQLEQNSAMLNNRLQLADDLDLIALFREMQSFEKEYLSIRQPAKIELMYKAAQQLRDRITTSSKLDPVERSQALRYLDAYVSVAKDIVELDREIQEKIRDFDKQAEALSNKLVDLANAEARRANSTIDITSHTATVLLVVSVSVALAAAVIIARQFASALSTSAIEQAKSERLLLNILPEPIAQRLKREERTIADYFPEVTVLFADIVGFTELAAQSSPIELVEILNVIFSEFDELTAKHSLEKIKTIGDSYMVVGGLPVEMPNHAEAIADMALDMQAVIEQYCQETGKFFSIRIGINTGPVIAGIIGTRKFIYDLWGDTVNIASRMESHGLPGSVQVTEVTYKHLRQYYWFEDRGLIQVKGKGQMNCYLLKGKRMGWEHRGLKGSRE